MEYWNNQIKTYTQTVLPYPQDTDPIVTSLHNGTHCLFWDPGVPIVAIKYQQKLKDFCMWANNRDCIMNTTDAGDLDWCANIVKFNLWVQDIQTQGIVKPFLLTYTGEKYYGINNGESRLRCTEVLPDITRVESWITTSLEHADRFKHLPQIENFEQFTEICRTEPGTDYMFRYTDKHAPYGIDWYEYDSNRTRSVTPSEEYCVDAIRKYLEIHPDTVFTTDWFRTPVEWSTYS